ncbi:unnamed protein product [Linum tenue]|uniref:Uncharacterized protein n=1 Tax=Linum tenue TaxID=586396 RepID=A0AAV0S1S9_9ROSI|nr:unnamed protein product [Linum tenue]
MYERLLVFWGLARGFELLLDPFIGLCFSSFRSSFKKPPVRKGMEVDEGLQG